MAELVTIATNLDGTPIQPIRKKAIPDWYDDPSHCQLCHARHLSATALPPTKLYAEHLATLAEDEAYANQSPYAHEAAQYGIELPSLNDTSE